MVKHNNVIPNGHFKKDWQNYVKTWFNQPARKKRRRTVRQKKAVAIFPGPTAGALRPIVRSQTVKYNTKIPVGRGLTFEELKEILVSNLEQPLEQGAGISKKLASTIGISVDHRRKNKCLESLQANVARLTTYKAKLVVFPRRTRKVKAGDSTPEELASVTQLQGQVLPIQRERPVVELVVVTDELKNSKAYAKIRVQRMNAKLVGVCKKKLPKPRRKRKSETILP